MPTLKRLPTSPVLFCGAAGFIVGTLALLLWIPRSAFPILGICTAFIGAISAAVVEPMVRDRPPGIKTLLLGGLVGGLMGFGIPAAGFVILILIGMLIFIIPYALIVYLALLSKIFTPAFFEGLVFWPVAGVLSGLFVGGRQGRPLPQTWSLVALALALGLVLLTPFKGPPDPGPTAQQDDIVQPPSPAMERRRAAAQLAEALAMKKTLISLMAAPNRLQYPGSKMVVSEDWWHLAQDTHDPPRVVRKYYQQHLDALFEPSKSYQGALPDSYSSGSLTYSGRNLAITLIIEKKTPNQTDINVFLVDPTGR